MGATTCEVKHNLRKFSLYGIIHFMGYGRQLMKHRYAPLSFLLSRPRLFFKTGDLRRS